MKLKRSSNAEETAVWEREVTCGQPCGLDCPSCPYSYNSILCSNLVPKNLRKLTKSGPGSVRSEPVGEQLGKGLFAEGNLYQ